MAKKTSKTKPSTVKRTRVSQSDVPAHSLEDALKVPFAIAENYGSDPTKPLNVAIAMEMTPTSSTFKMLTGAAIAYGLTDGGYNASEISLTELARCIVAPLEEGADDRAKVEAFLKPRIINEFCSKYNDSALPREDIAMNVLTDMGVPKDRAASVFKTIVNGIKNLGLTNDLKGKIYINLDNQRKSTTDVIAFPSAASDEESHEVLRATEIDVANPKMDTNYPLPESANVDYKAKKVFVAHGKNKALTEPIKKLLAFGELEAVVSVEIQSVSKPVPQKVMDEMRSCGAAIIHVDSEIKLMDQEANEHIVLNPNVLIEIGAAMALFPNRFILLVKEGATLPSNLQGMFEVRYSGSVLDGDATMRLLEAINHLKKQPLASF